jgi:hypothetical protein
MLILLRGLFKIVSNVGEVQNPNVVNLTLLIVCFNCLHL